MRVEEMSSSELFTEMTDRQRDEIFRMVWFGNVEDDVRTYINVLRRCIFRRRY